MNKEIMKEFLWKGKEKELEFAELLQSRYGGTITLASKQEDIYQHIDLYWNEFSFDVKGIKRSSRSGKLNDAIHWIELQNVNGNKGWLYGNANYFAFETSSSWILIKSNDLRKFITKNVDLSRVTNNRDESLYKLYQRNGRRDLITKVLTSDLIKISRKIINK